jgi:hypothetical protein|tara:strand:+ start:230 stop:415 length:186 start_codon:yes stop_codon:yes gene_type:complete
MKKLSARQKEMLKSHTKPHKNKKGETVAGHSKKHIDAMRVMIQHGMSFDNSHDAAMKIFGK